MATLMETPAREYAVRLNDIKKAFRGGMLSDKNSWLNLAVTGLSRLRRPPAPKAVVDSVSLTVRRGELFGLLGPNGAGKTTLLKLIACLLYPDAGGGTVNGYDLRDERTAIRRSVAIAKAQGWLGMLWQLTGRQNLLFRARLCGLSGKLAAARIDYVLERLAISHRADAYSWEWSTGETQRFNLAGTFIAQTPLVILDEPTSHLDPHIARLVREFIKEDLNERNGQTVIMSTHYLEEADLLCDRVGLLSAGRLLACDAPQELKRRYTPKHILEFRVSNYNPVVGAQIKQDCGLVELLAQFDDVPTGRARLRPKWPDGLATTIDMFVGALVSKEIALHSVRQVKPTLDDVYFHLTQGRVDE